MLLFHGTGGDRATIEGILRDGLTPHGGRAWAHQGTGVEEHVFACTSPVGSKNGDPIAYARGGAHRDGDAWLIVLDLPDAARGLVIGAVPNGELERYWQTTAFAGAVIEAQLVDAIAVIERARERGVACRELLAPRVVRVLDGLVDGTPDAATLLGFEAAYLRAAFADKRRVAEGYGLRLPDWYVDDGHYATCAACTHQIFDVVFAAAGVATRAHHEANRALDTNDVLFHRGTFQRIDAATMGALLDALGRWLDAHPPAQVKQVLRRARVTLAELQAALPPPRDQVPRTMWPDFLTADLAARCEEPDTQLLLTAAPPDTIAGAIHLGDRHRFAASVRPASGQTLAANLWARVAELRARRRATGHAVVLD
jgi:hypothetical protein